jgi:ATP/maltotriose-dependent transcriptional regulator MalT
VIHISRRWSVDSELAAVAFGDQPGRWPLPAATTPHQQWLRAVGAAGQGRYGTAYADLATLRAAAPSDRLSSLAHSAHASFLRQLGWHSLARGWDGRARALAADDPEAAGDALTGLAADALGVGRLAAAATLLQRAEPFVVQAPPRLAIRKAWVAAELAMVGGDGGAAVRNAEVAVELAATTLDGSARHRAKSQVVLAAALCSGGVLDRARDVADAALGLTGHLGLVPLRWAVACLLVDLGTETPTRIAELRDLRDDCARRVEHWGGAWRKL